MNIEIHNVSYRMEIRGGGDIWRIVGEIYNHPNFVDGTVVWPSCPVEYVDDLIPKFMTGSGYVYEIHSFAENWNGEKFKEQIIKDIESGYEIH